MVFDNCNVDHLASLIDSGIKGRCKFPITLPAFSIVPGKRYSVFLTPTINPELINIQKSLYNHLSENGYSTRKHYEPHNWLPHCSISKELSLTKALKTLEVCLNTTTIRGTLISDIGFIEFRPRKVIKTIVLADSDYQNSHNNQLYKVSGQKAALTHEL
jgi:hypothetical protein